MRIKKRYGCLSFLNANPTSNFFPPCLLKGENGPKIRDLANKIGDQEIGFSLITPTSSGQAL